MAQRISRAKQSIRAAGGGFEMPPEPERAERLRVVLHVLYLMFNEGYIASSGPDLQRSELTREAIRLTRAVHALLPDDGEVAGLLALMLLTDARRAARTGADGTLIALADQDRSLWNRRLHRRGHGAHHRRARTRHPRPLPAAGGDRRRPRRGAGRAGHRLAADPRPLRAAGPGGTQPDGHPQPRRRGGDGRRSARRARAARPRWTATSAWPTTTVSTPSARTCSRWPATTAQPARATAPRRGARRASPSSATSRPVRRGSAAPRLAGRRLTRRARAPRSTP